MGEGELSVGIRAEIEHSAPSRVGAVLVAEAELVDDSKGRYTFEVRVLDDSREVARVGHTRAVVPAAAIMSQLG